MRYDVPLKLTENCQCIYYLTHGAELNLVNMIEKLENDKERRKSEVGVMIQITIVVLASCNIM